MVVLAPRDRGALLSFLRVNRLRMSVALRNVYEVLKRIKMRFFGGYCQRGGSPLVFIPPFDTNLKIFHMNTTSEIKGMFGVSIRYDDESKYRRFAEGCSPSVLSDMCALACRLSKVKYIRIDEHIQVKPFKRFTL